MTDAIAAFMHPTFAVMTAKLVLERCCFTFGFMSIDATHS